MPDSRAGKFGVSDSEKVETLTAAKHQTGRCKGISLLAAALWAIVLPGFAGAQSASAEPAPRPKLRPAAAKSVPPPDPRPAAPIFSDVAAGGKPATTCLARLKSLGVTFSAAEPIRSGGGCHVPAPVSVTEVAPGIRLTPVSRLNCHTAEALARWTHDIVLPAALSELGSRPSALVHDSTYACRRRNNRPGGKLSEHATGNAIDIRAIAFADRDPVSVRQRNARAGAEKRFQARLRKGACRYFTTVLGPGTDAAHASHFHFDLARRKGGYRLCR